MGIHVKPLDQGSGAGIRVGIQYAVRMAAAGEEALQAQHVDAVLAADDDRSARAAFQKSHAAQDERAHDALAEGCLLDHQVSQSPRGNDERLDRLDGLGGHERGRFGELRQFADETAWAMDDDRLVPIAAASW